ncbi:MAG: hypothetical protein ACI8ZT_002388, partial [Bacteroidia bacterium]
MLFRSVFLAITLMATNIVFADVTEELTFEYSLDSGGRISVDNINGNITVIGGSGNSVEIVATKKGDNQDVLDKINIAIDASTDAIRIETEYPDKNGKGW